MVFPTGTPMSGAERDEGRHQEALTTPGDRSTER
jgi:hypothetical protein